MENRLIGLGSKFPAFNKTAVTSLEVSKEFETLNSEELLNNGKWTVFFWWPKDFTFVCPTEIAGFNDVYEEFKSKNTQLIGASTDSEYVHLAWRNSHPALKHLKFPMLADTSKSLGEELGVLEANEKVAYRATYIIDPKGDIRWLDVCDLSVGRNVSEVLRVLNALQTDKLTPCNWSSGEDTL